MLIGRSTRFTALVISFVLTLLFLVAAGGAAWAMRVSPMVVELATRGARSSARIEVGNVGGVPLPFETSVTLLSFEADGSIVETSADDDFLVFPPQGVVPVGGRQMIRLQWVGEGDLEESRAYYLSVNQLPVETDINTGSDGTVAVTVLYNMKALVVVAPPGAQPDVKVVSAVLKERRVEQLATEGGETDEATHENGIEVVVRNEGKRYALMSGASWNVTATLKNGSSFVKRFESGSELSAKIGVGYLAPSGAERIFFLPIDDADIDPTKPISVVFSR